MSYLFDFLNQDKSFARATAAYTADRFQTMIYGLSGSPKSALIAHGFTCSPRATLLITGSQEAVEQYRLDFETLLPGVPVWELPATDIITFSADAKSLDLAAKRMQVLSVMATGKPMIVLATGEAAMQKVIPLADFLNNRVVLSDCGVLDRDELLSTFVRFGYERTDEVNSVGQFAARGGIIDVFPLNRDWPVRLELFGDEVDSLREFDPHTQRSVSSVSTVEVLPVIEPEHSGKLTDLFAYLPAKATVIFDEPSRVREQLSRLNRENPAIKKQVWDWQKLVISAQQRNVLYLSLMAQKSPHTEPVEMISCTMRGVAPYHRQIDLLTEDLRDWQAKGTSVVIFMSSQEKAAAFSQSLAEEGLTVILGGADTKPARGATLIMPGGISGGFELPHAKSVWLAEKDIFGRQKLKRRMRIAKDKQIQYFRDINIGDYVVHINHGIGKYVGVETLAVDGVHKDYLFIRYAGEDKLYLPTDQVHMLQKYIGSEGEVPRLSKMGGSDWLKAKTKAKAAVADIAKELLALYAERQVAKGFAFPTDTTWQAEFEEAFAYEETPDQLTALVEVKADMEKPQPMDRLLCGDVGFGKTEVAIRAAFKAVVGGKQVAVLVPTTVLAQQHFQTFSARFAGFGPVIDVISRFRSAKQQKATIAKLAAGRVDILIGTHRILQSDVAFKDLGLLIVDEEQRFGVSQKEQLKRWRANVDVLTLTATPIPRTLHMSLSGTRDMSIIETPPEDRFPVQTYVVEYEETIIREALRRELKRGGQAYFVYNRVQTIDKMHEHLSEMLPDARIRTAHGQMPEELLEQVMFEFYEGQFDILVCTSIIENGLDVANANTMIVYDADFFGLSQLYQMRGRVGRSHRMAFSYFTYRRDKVLTEVAEKRLQAIKEFAELGAGFKIAMRDLEIRGAGNLLGAQQHGHIATVGFELYCRLLEEAVQELRGGGQVIEKPPDPVLELNTEAYLTGEYIADAMHKMEIYQRIAAIRNEEQIVDLVDELVDRFGDMPAPVLNLLSVARIKNLARLCGIRSLIERKDNLEIQFTANPNVNPNAIMDLKSRYPGRISLLPGPPQSIRLKTAKLTMPVLEWLEKLLAAMCNLPQ
ncbi:MAG: transcription-repair coupling factor [Anaerosporomusa subterranea]|jgi:transcription-repair coupling factor (superfamily II helicase)|nr:transcription-repair coupling factor [Anaerosporomusa subterranea]